jgi:hypothetical protein
MPRSRNIEVHCLGYKRMKARYRYNEQLAIKSTCSLKMKTRLRHNQIIGIHGNANTGNVNLATKCLLFRTQRPDLWRDMESQWWRRDPCGGGVEYLHRDPASRRRRLNGKSQIWDSKIWSRVQRGSDQRMNALARASSKCKRQTCPLVRESAPHQQTRNCPTAIKIWS